jgi:SAM-dependent methyltransferase
MSMLSSHSLELKNSLAAHNFKGPFLRRDLIKQTLIRNHAEFRITKSAWKKYEKQLFAFPPIIDLKQQEIDLLRDFALLKSQRQIQLVANDIHSVKNGGASLYRDSSAKSRENQEITAEDAIRTPSIFYTANLISRNCNKEFSTFGSRGLSEYLEEGNIDVLSYVQNYIESNEKTPHVLDVGACGAQMLFELKQKLGDKVLTSALSPFDEPRLYTDFSYIKFAEYLPRAFSRSFDLIFSHRALEYAVFPDLALKNITECLAPAGVAVVQWRSGRAFMFINDLAMRFCSLENYQCKDLLDNYFLEWLGHFTKSRNDLRSKRTDLNPTRFEELDSMAASIDKADYLQALSFAKAVMRLEADPQFICRVTNSEANLGGYRIPAELEIRRVR